MKDVEEKKDIVNEGKKPTGKKAEKLQRLQPDFRQDHAAGKSRSAEP